MDTIREYYRMWLKIASFVVVVFLTVWFWHVWQHWAAHATGSYNCPPAGCPGGSPHNYNFWSGFGSDIGQYTIATGIWGNVVLAWRAHTCHYTWWCWRHGHYQLEGTPFKLCHKHHPDEGLHATAQDAMEAMKAA